jgi:hypothetical protein
MDQNTMTSDTDDLTFDAAALDEINTARRNVLRRRDHVVASASVPLPAEVLGRMYALGAIEAVLWQLLRDRAGTREADALAARVSEAAAIERSARKETT